MNVTDHYQITRNMFHATGTNVVGLSVDGKGDELDEQNGKTNSIPFN